MGMDATMISLIEADARSDVTATEGLEAKLRVAMSRALNHFMAPDDDTAFRGAVTAVLMHYKSGAEYDASVAELDIIKRANALIAALQAGIPIDGAALADSLKETPDSPIIPLMKMWHEEKAKRT